MKIGDEVMVHGYVDEIRADVIIIRNKGGYFGTAESEVYRVERKTENSSEKPNNCETCIWSVCNYNKAFEDEPQTRTDEDGRVWEYRNGNWWQLGKDEPQTEREGE